MKTGKLATLVLAMCMLLAWGGACLAHCGGCAAPGAKAEKGEAAVVKPQTTCPVMGGKINKKLFVDVKGARVYVCCAGCLPKIKADPDKYIAKIKEKGETPELVGKVGGKDKCCAPGTRKGAGCGMTRGRSSCGK